MIKIPARLYDAVARAEQVYAALPLKLRLFIGMLIAANTAAMAIYVSINFLITEVGYWVCLGSFLAVRVYLFMANPSLPLTDKNVAFMSSERTLWNIATIAVLGVMAFLKFLTN